MTFARSLLVLACAVAVLGQWRSLPGTDVSWLLYAARRMLAGARLGHELWENTPPLIIWAKLPLVALAGGDALAEWRAWMLATTALCGWAAAATAAVLRPILLPRGARPLDTALVVSAALLVLPEADFGQREHVAVAATLPFVALAAARLAGATAGRPIAVMVGVAAGLGFAIKPHFVLVPALLVLLRLARLGGRDARAPELVAAVAAGTVAIVAGLVVHPAYLQYALVFGGLYSCCFMPNTLLTAALFGDLALPILFAILAAALLVRASDDTPRPLLVALLVATTGWYVVAVLQRKGWSYHAIPAYVVAWLLLLGVIAATASRTALLARVLVPLAGGAAAAMLGVGIGDAVARVRRPLDAAFGLNQDLEKLVPVVAAYGQLGDVAMLSTNLASAFPAVPLAGATWSLRVPGLWYIGALYAPTRPKPGEMPRYHAPEARPASERALLTALAEDLERSRPAALLAVRPEPMSPALAHHFDYLAYLRTDARLATVLEAYELADTVGAHLLLVRRDLRGTPLPAPGARVPRVVRHGPRPDHRPVAALAFLLGVIATALPMRSASRSRRGAG